MLYSDLSLISAWQKQVQESNSRSQALILDSVEKERLLNLEIQDAQRIVCIDWVTSPANVVIGIRFQEEAQGFISSGRLMQEASGVCSCDSKYALWEHDGFHITIREEPYNPEVEG